MVPEGLRQLDREGTRETRAGFSYIGDKSRHYSIACKASILSWSETNVRLLWLTLPRLSLTLLATEGDHGVLGSSSSAAPRGQVYGLSRRYGGWRGKRVGPTRTRRRRSVWRPVLCRTRRRRGIWRPVFRRTRSSHFVEGVTGGVVQDGGDPDFWPSRSCGVLLSPGQGFRYRITGPRPPDLSEEQAWHGDPKDDRESFVDRLAICGAYQYTRRHPG